MKSNITEAKTAPLYHGTSVDKLVNILRTNTLATGRVFAKDILQGKKQGSISLSRVRDYAKNYGNALIQLDQELLTFNYKLLPTGDWSNSVVPQAARKTTCGQKAEETIARNIRNIKKYITRIDVNTVEDAEKLRPYVDNIPVFVNESLYSYYTDLSDEDAEKLMR